MALWALEDRDGKVRVDYLGFSGLIQPCGDTDKATEAVDFCIRESNAGDVIQYNGWLFQHMKEAKC